MKAAELRSQSLSQLKETLSQSLRDQFKLKLSQRGGELSYPHRIGLVRRDIARILTVMAEKGRADNE